ncbi:3094_t:CDS:2 [Scutellospora calospora]|uniref:3094_t:CDS:1 n=1 Tax=Scutellospora calospora TaxID=85575 RepID=A0ACA9KW32_9GLOM|nr:3094_t:CDS:2 [Scutellospora calospora]
MAATTDDIMNYLKANTKYFEKATTANRWDSKRKRDILPGFLHGVADEWQTTFYVTQNTAGTPN